MYLNISHVKIPPKIYETKLSTSSWVRLFSCYCEIIKGGLPPLSLTFIPFCVAYRLHLPVGALHTSYLDLHRFDTFLWPSTWLPCVVLFIHAIIDSFSISGMFDHKYLMSLAIIASFSEGLPNICQAVCIRDRSIHDSRNVLTFGCGNLVTPSATCLTGRRRCH